MSAGEDLDDLSPEDAEAALAAEFALRLLGPAEHAACAAREAVDPAFAAAVARWRADLAPLDRAYPETPPPAAARDRIETRLFGARPSALARLWASAAFWRGLAVAATLAAVWFAVPLAPPEAPGPRLVSALAPATGTTEFLAVYDPATAALSVNRVAGAAAPGRSLELWVIPGETATPVSLGVLSDVSLSSVSVSPEVASLFAAGAVLAVTDEPAGGSPSGAPTGAVLSAGPLRDI